MNDFVGCFVGIGILEMDWGDMGRLGGHGLGGHSGRINLARSTRTMGPEPGFPTRLPRTAPSGGGGPTGHHAKGGVASSRATSRLAAAEARREAQADAAAAPHAANGGTAREAKANGVSGGANGGKASGGE